MPQNLEEKGEIKSGIKFILIDRILLQSHNTVAKTFVNRFQAFKVLLIQRGTVSWFLY